MKFPLTNQEAFDIALNGVVNQGSACLGEHGECLYDGSNGLHCAAGHIFKKSHPHLDFTRFDFFGMTAEDVLTSLGYNDYDLSVFLCEIQTAHDGPGMTCSDSFIVEYKKSMQEVAKHYKLEFNLESEKS